MCRAFQILARLFGHSFRPTQPHKQMENKKPRGHTVNTMTAAQCARVIEHMKKDGVLVLERGYWKCKLASTGKCKHAQYDLNRFHFDGIEGKQLVHLIYWRAENNGALIDPNMHISHLDANPDILRLVQETRDENESRKYCHLFGWYKRIKGEEIPRCPHRENPCSGPV